MSIKFKFGTMPIRNGISNVEPFSERMSNINIGKYINLVESFFEYSYTRLTTLDVAAAVTGEIRFFTGSVSKVTPNSVTAGS